MSEIERFSWKFFFGGFLLGKSKRIWISNQGRIVLIGGDGERLQTGEKEMTSGEDGWGIDEGHAAERPDESDLVRALDGAWAARGSEFDFWRSFVGRSLPPVLRGQMEPEDILQEACLSVFKKRKKIPANRLDARRWFGRVIRNVINNRSRFLLRKKRCSRIGPPSHPVFVDDETPSDLPSPEEAAAIEENLNAILEAISSLPEKEAIAILYVGVGGLSLRDAARLMQIDPAEISRFLYRGRKALRLKLDRRTI